jgi:hypothetical protein
MRLIHALVPQDDIFEWLTHDAGFASRTEVRRANPTPRYAINTGGGT